MYDSAVRGYRILHAGGNSDFALDEVHLRGKDSAAYYIMTLDALKTIAS